MLDIDLAELYTVMTGTLNQAVKRNKKRFPEDFMFQLTKEERDEVITFCDNLKKLKFSPSLPYAFTEQGVSMLSSVLNSERAINVNIQIMRTFTKLREMIEGNKELKLKIENLEKKYDKQFQIVFDAIKHLIEPEIKPKRKIGFYIADEEVKNLKGFNGNPDFQLQLDHQEVAICLNYRLKELLIKKVLIIKSSLNIQHINDAFCKHIDLLLFLMLQHF